MEGEFDAVGSDYDGAYFRFGEVTYDVESLEVVAEFVVLPDWNGEEKAAVITSVEGGGERVEAEFLAEVNGIAHERHSLGVNLRSETGLPDEALDSVSEAAGDEIAETWHNLRVFEKFEYVRRKGRLEVFADEIFVLVKLWLLVVVLRLVKLALFAFQHAQSEVGSSEAARNAEQVHALCGHPALCREPRRLPTGT